MLQIENNNDSYLFMIFLALSLPLLSLLSYIIFLVISRINDYCLSDGFYVNTTLLTGWCAKGPEMPFLGLIKVIKPSDPTFCPILWTHKLVTPKITGFGQKID